VLPRRLRSPHFDFRTPGGAFRLRFSGRTVTRIHSHTSKPHRATADSGPSVFKRQLGFRSVPRDPTAHRASGRYRAPLGPRPGAGRYTRRPTGPGRAVPRVPTEPRQWYMCHIGSVPGTPTSSAKVPAKAAAESVHVYRVQAESTGRAGRRRPRPWDPGGRAQVARTQASRLELAIRHLAAILLIEYQAADLSTLATA
jgi:hypothetical protein